MDFWSWSKVQLIAKKVLFAHLVQLDGTLYVMLQNVSKIKLANKKFDFDEKRYIGIYP